MYLHVALLSLVCTIPRMMGSVFGYRSAPDGSVTDLHVHRTCHVALKHVPSQVLVTVALLSTVK